MAIVSTEAVVLRGWKLGETSKILSLFTRDKGKIKVVAKGGRGPKSQFKGCLESLTHLRIIFYHKSTRDLQLLSKTDLINPHIRIIGNPVRTALALSVIELLDKAIQGEETHSDIFDLTVRALRAINNEDRFLEGVFWFFETRLIDLMGYKPTWDVCLKCGQSLGDRGGHFQPGSGGLFCKGCGLDGGGLTVDADTLEILYWLQRDDIQNVGSLNPTITQKAEIRKMFDLYFNTHIAYRRGLKSLQMFYSFTAN